MPNIYHAPESHRVSEHTTDWQKTNWWLLGVALLIAYLGVTYLSSFVNNLLVHLWVEPTSVLYWPVRLTSDLLQSSGYLFIAGVLLARATHRWRYWVCATVCAFFMVNTFRIIGWHHIIFEMCDYHWYDILSVIKTPVALFGGCVVGSKMRQMP
ncbi:hypothetical protein [Halioxenophilus aromaticivorans]|uniref:Uncharacterized protein n=1 Tax=Halioxenophilus aromaticivorans TaxID=1306992 RepID=A0AAV3U1Y0_9ALTE